MRNLRLYEAYRMRGPAVVHLFGSEGDHTCGAFAMPSPIDKQELRIIAAVGEGWDHVSVSRRNRLPNWIEMDWVKRQFFLDDETAMQLHVPAADHINYHPYCLHLWRPLDREIPRPPADMVGPTTGSAA